MKLHIDPMNTLLVNSTTIALLFDRVPPWLVANFNAASRLMSVVVVETLGTTWNGGAEKSPEQFVRVAVAPSSSVADVQKESIMRRIERALDQISPGVVVVLGWSGKRDLGALRWCLRNHVPAVVASDSTVQDYSRSWFKEFVKRRVVRLFSSGWAAGSLSADYLAVLGIPRERIVSGPVDTIDLRHFSDGADAARGIERTIRQRLGLPERYFFAASRFSVEKNIPGLLQAYSRYRGHAGTGAWSLVLAGDGPLKSDIEGMVRGLGLENSVLLPGYIPFNLLPEYYGLAEVFVHASKRDTWAVVVNEAMAAGLPVIVSNRCGCVPELVKDGLNGFVIDPDDINRLSDRLWQIAHGDSNRAAMGQESRNIIAGWSPEAYAASLQSVVDVALRAPLPKYGITDRLLLLALVST